MLEAIVCGATAAFLLLTAQQVHAAAAWCVCAPLAWISRRELPLRQALAVAWSLAAVMAVLGEGPWLIETAHRYLALTEPFAWATGLALVSACGLFFGALLGLGLFGAGAVPTVYRPWIVGAAWVAFEELLVRIVPYYPWASLGVTQTSWPPAAQLASLLGERGLSLVLALLGCQLGAALRSFATGKSYRSNLAFAGLMAGLVLGFGSLRLALTPLTSSACTMALVDASVEPSATHEGLQHYTDLTLQVPATASVVVWPESALLSDPSTDESLQRALHNLVQNTGKALLAGGPRRAWDTDWSPRLFNSAFLLEPSGGSQFYDKRHRAPFAEYWPQLGLPQPSWLGIETIGAGQQAGLFRTAACNLGVVICFEAEHAGLAHELAAKGATAIVILANDAQLPSRAAARERHHAQMRALETGLPVARATNNGVSLVVDPLGRVVAQAQGRVLNSTLAQSINTHAALASTVVNIVTGFVIAVAIARRVLSALTAS